MLYRSSSLLLFVFVPKMLRAATRADTEAVIEAFGKNEQLRKVFWTVFLVSKVIRLETGEECGSILRLARRVRPGAGRGAGPGREDPCRACRNMTSFFRENDAGSIAANL